MTRRRIALAGLVAWVSLMPYCSRETSYQTPPTPVAVAEVQEYEPGGEIRYSATIIPYAQVDLAFKSGGYVRSIRQVKGADGRIRALQAGDHVSAGMILAQVRQDDYAIRADQTKKQLAQANWSLESARSQLARAEAALNQAQLDFTRAKNLLESQSLTKSDYDSAKSRLDADQAGVSSARSQVDACGAQAGAAEDAVKAAELSLADATLLSPMDAVVLRRAVEVGTLVGSGSLGFVIADIRSVKAVFGVPDTMAGRVRLGMEQAITAQAVQGETKGRITAISPAADSVSRTFSVEVTVPNPREILKPGMIATLSLAGTKTTGPVAVIPLSAVIRSAQNPQGFAVFVVEDQSGTTLARMRDVDLGEAYGNMIGVKSGVKLAERVITTGSTLVKDGWQVQVIP